MKLELLVNSQDALKKIIQADMPVKKSYELSKFTLLVEEKLKAFYNVHDKLVQKYWKEGKDGIFSVKKENLEKFGKDIDVLLQEEIEIDIPEISIDDLDGKINASTLIQLSYLIK